jgi:hypothetical protein
LLFLPLFFFFFDLSLASLKTTLYALGFHEANLWQSFSRILAGDLQAQLSSTKECLSCKGLNQISFDTSPSHYSQTQKAGSTFLLHTLSSPVVSLVVDGPSNTAPETPKIKTYPEMETSPSFSNAAVANVVRSSVVSICADTTAILEQFKPKPSEPVVLETASFSDLC